MSSETWPLSKEDLYRLKRCKEDLYRLKRCDHAMIRWICGVKIMQPHSTDSLRSKLQIPCIEDVM